MLCDTRRYQTIYRLHSQLHLSVTRFADKFQRQNVDPSPLAESGVANVLLEILSECKASSDALDASAVGPQDVDVPMSRTIVSLLTSLRYHHVLPAWIRLPERQRAKERDRKRMYALDMRHSLFLTAACEVVLSSHMFSLSMGTPFVTRALLEANLVHVFQGALMSDEKLSDDIVRLLLVIFIILLEGRGALGQVHQAVMHTHVVP